MKIRGSEIRISDCKKQLRVKFDHKLTFDSHISIYGKKASCKINTLAKVEPYMDIAKKRN